MKARMICSGLLGLAAVGLLYAADTPAPPKETPKAEVVTVKGEVVDLWCYIDSGAMGAAHKDCAVTCAKAGNPIGLVDDKGVAYLLVGKDMGKPGRDTLIANMAGTVTVKGTIGTRGGLKAIYFESLTPAVVVPTPAPAPIPATPPKEVPK